MECLYCHKKFSSFRFWKGSEFCSKEHEDAYRSQTLNRLMDVGGDPSKSSVALEDALSRVPEAPGTTASEYTGPRQLVAPTPGASSSPPGEFDLPPAGTHALESSSPASSWRSELEHLSSIPSSTDSPSVIGAGDVDLQTPEEALNALRELARSSRGSSRNPALSTPDLPVEQEDLPDIASFQAESSAATDEIDADDVFAELRRMAAATGETERLEQAEEAVDLPTAPEGFSAFDRLMESPAPSRTGLGKPSVDRRRADSLPPTEQPAAREKIPAEQDPSVAATKKEAAEETVQVEAREPAPVETATAAEKEVEQPAAEMTASLEAEHPDPETKTATPEKVVSFPGPRQGAGHEDTGHKPGRMARPRGGASALFDSGTHDEFMTVNLGELLRATSGLPAERSALVLDETLKAPAASSCGAPAKHSESQSAGVDTFWRDEMITVLPQALAPLSGATTEAAPSDLREPEAPRFPTVPLAFFKTARELPLAEQWYDRVPGIALREADAQTAVSVERDLEPSRPTSEPHLPAGLAESMGVVPPNRGQLIRSELFTKEPEVRESAGPAWEATLETDVRRAYYRQRGTA